MRKTYVDCFNTLWQAIVGYYAVVVLFLLAMEIPYIVSGCGRIAGVQFFGSFAALQLSLKSGQANALWMGYWNYLGSLLLMAFAILIARSSNRWIQSGAAYLVLFASSFLAKLILSTLIMETDQLSIAIRSLFPNGDVWTAKLMVLAALCLLMLAANYFVFRIIARRASSSLPQKLGAFTIRFALPILLFSLLAAGRASSIYDGFEFNVISFLLAIIVGLIAWLLPYRKVARLASE